MSKRLSASFVNLVHEAALKSFWRRKTLRRFLRQQGISEGFLASWDDTESKRDFLDRLFAKLPDQRGGDRLLRTLAHDLAEQTSFPDLQGWDNTPQLLKEAHAAVGLLKAAVRKLDQQVISERERSDAQERLRRLHEETARSRSNLETLDARLSSLAQLLGTQQAGYDFQDWFYDLVSHFEVVNRRPYVSNGRQIDGSITVTGTTYLIEIKFTAEQAGATDVDTFYKKVTGKADNTMGIMISISGYSSTAVSEASGPRTPLLLLDHNHLYLALTGVATLPEIVERVRRHASQTGEAFLPVGAFHQ